MTEYINRDSAIKMMRGSAIAKYPLSFSNGILAAANELQKMPAADVYKVVHGRWGHMHDFVFNCTHCGNISEVETCIGKPKWSYCPNCGARMSYD